MGNDPIAWLMQTGWRMLDGEMRMVTKGLYCPGGQKRSVLQMPVPARLWILYMNVLFNVNVGGMS